MKLLATCMTTLFLVVSNTDAFSATSTHNTAVPPSPKTFHTPTKAPFVTSPSVIIRSSSSKMFLSPNDILPSILLSDEVEAIVSATTSPSSSGAEWKQYVPLIASCFVILDILLGSPFLNIVTAPMKRAAEQGGDSPSPPPSQSSGGGGGGGLLSLFSPPPIQEEDLNKERVDSEAIAQAALDKARNSLELRNYLEENKTNEQRYEEIRKEIDGQMDDFDSGRFGPGGKGIDE